MSTAFPLITYEKKIYTCPFSRLFRRHTEEELANMRASIRAHGVQVAIRTYEDTTLNLTNCILDGEGRLTSAVAVSAPKKQVPFFSMGKLTTEQAYVMAKVFNDDRRHDDPEVIRERREKRIEREVALRSEGNSYRAIAETVGVSEKQVRKDLGDAPADRSAPRSESHAPIVPATVKGRDGKSYPAERPADPTVEVGADRSAPKTSTKKKPQPKWMKNARKADLNHPFAKLLALHTLFAREMTLALATDEGKVLLDYLTKLQSARLRCPLFIRNRMLVIDGKTYGAQFIGLKGLRRIVKLAGESSRKQPATLIKEFQEAIEESLDGEEGGIE